VTWPQILVAVAQVAAGGTIAQSIMALVRRRSELRKLDREAESVAVETADKLVVMLRTELNDAKERQAHEREQHEREREDLRRRIAALGDETAGLRAKLAAAQSEIARLNAADQGP
jgi:chromosome segregation ATPase